MYPRGRAAERWSATAVLALSLSTVVVPMSMLTRAIVVPAIMGVVGSASAAVVLMSAGRATGRTRLAWRLLGASISLWAATRFFTAAWTAVHRAPTPRLDGLDLVLTVAVLCAVAGVCTLPGRRSTDRTGRLLGVLDTLTVVGNVALALWMTLVHAILHHGFVRPHEKVSLLIFVGFDVIMVTRALMLASRPPVGRRAASTLFAVGWIAFASADIHIMSGLANGAYRVGTPGDSGWLIGTVALAASARLWAGPADERTASVLWRAVLLPYAVLPVTVTVCLIGASNGAAFGAPGILLTGLVVTVVFARQLVTLAQNTQLVADMAHQEDELRHLATHDALTGLANRRLFRERLEDGIRGAPAEEQIAVIFIDLDDFKVVNDTRGHVVGDELLRRMAERLSECVRGSDLAARLGGDEFAVLLTHGGEAGAQVVAERLSAAMQQPLIVGGESFFIRASLGIAVGSAGLDGLPEELLAQADMAMYAAKDAGKARLKVYQSGMRDRLADSVETRVHNRADAHG